MNSIVGELSNNIVNHHCTQIGVTIADYYLFNVYFNSFYTSELIRIQIPPAHASIISKYYQLNEKCGMTISKPLKEFERFSLSFQLQKNSPYTETVNK